MVFTKFLQYKVYVEKSLQMPLRLVVGSVRLTIGHRKLWQRIDALAWPYLLAT